MKIPLLACVNSWNSSALSLPKWVNRTLLTWRHRDTYGATPGSLQLGDPMAYGSSAGQQQGRVLGRSDPCCCSWGRAVRACGDAVRAGCLLDKRSCPRAGGRSGQKAKKIRAVKAEFHGQAVSGLAIV